MDDEPRPPERGSSRGRVLVRRVVAGVLAVAAAVPFFGLIDLGTIVGLSDPTVRWEVPLEASWGSLFTFFVAGAYAWLAVGRAPRIATLQLAVVTVALVVASLAGADPAPLPVALAIGASAVLLCLLDHSVIPLWRGAWPGTRPTARPRASAPSAASAAFAVPWADLVVAVAGVAIWLPYTLSALARSRTGAEGDVTNGIEHWPVQGATGFAVLLGALLLAALPPASWSLRSAVAVSGAVIGLAALSYPDRLGATEGPAWAIAAAVWALLVAVAPWLPGGRGAPAARPAGATAGGEGAVTPH